jgi:DNA-binding transcriptional MerR regulator
MGSVPARPQSVDEMWRTPFVARMAVLLELNRHVPEQTIRTWTERGLVRSRRNPDLGRLEVSLADVLREGRIMVRG